MGANDPGSGTGDTPESLKAEWDDLEKIVASIRQMTRDFDALTEQEKQFDPKGLAFVLHLKAAQSNRCVWKGILTPEILDWLKPAMAEQKALGERMLQDLAALAQAAIGWAEDLERREKDYRAKDGQQAPDLSYSPSVPIVTQGNGPMPDEARAPDAIQPAPILRGAGIVPGAVAGAVGDAIADTGIVFINMSGPAKAPYNPVDATFGYQDAFWKILGVTRMALS
jgi:hypothetical protein